MYKTLFRNWKFAALWTIGISASVGVFFTDGGGHEQFEESAQEIRERRNPAREVPESTDAAGTVAPVAAGAPVVEKEETEPEFGAPSLDPSVDADAESGLAGQSTEKPAESDEPVGSQALTTSH